MWENLGECISDLEYNKEQSISVKDTIEFAKWCHHLDNGTTHYDPFNKKVTKSIGFSPYDCITDNTYTFEELFEKWKLLNKQK